MSEIQLGKKPLISVIIPVYNVEKYIDRCIGSIVNNSYHKLQIICVDDGSTDGSGYILDKWKKKDSRIHVITKKNQGVAEARNTGIQEAKGEYITFVDSDDWLHPNYFSSLLSGMLNNDVAISMCGHIRTSSDQDVAFNNAENIQWKVLGKRQFLNLRSRNYVWGKLFKRDLIHPIFDSSLSPAEDIGYILTIVLNNSELKIALTEEVLYFYYNRPGSLINSSDGEETKKLFDVLYSIVQKDGIEKRTISQELFIPDMVKASLSYRYTCMFDPARKKRSNQNCMVSQKILLKAKSISLKDKLLFGIFLFLPLSYRLFRIIDDPTLINWERSQKRKYKRV